MASPAPPLDAALPSGRPQRSQTPAPSPPATTSHSTAHPPSAWGRGLLSTRVLTVEDFRQERLIRSRLNPPPPPPSRAIPVPLYPGESVEQYNHKFEQWLAQRNESLDALRDRPKRERQFRLAFAFLRDGQRPHAAETKRPHAPKRKSLDEEYDEFYRRSASQEIKRSRRDRSRERDRSESRGRSPTTRHADERSSYRDTRPTSRERLEPRAYSRSSSRPRDRGIYDDPLGSCKMRPRSSSHRSASPASHTSNKAFRERHPGEILAYRVVSVDNYLRELKLPKNIRHQRGPEGRLAKIPVPLFPGETIVEFDRAFDRWLQQHRSSLMLLRFKPMKERIYRFQFAQQRVMGKSSSYSAERSESPTRSKSPPSTNETTRETHEQSGSDAGQPSLQRHGDPNTSAPTHSPQQATGNDASTTEDVTTSTSASFALTSTRINDDQDETMEHPDTAIDTSSLSFRTQVDKHEDELKSPVQEIVPTDTAAGTNSRPQAINDQDDLMPPASDTEHTDTAIDTYPSFQMKTEHQAEPTSPASSSENAAFDTHSRHQVNRNEDEFTSPANSPELTHQEPDHPPPALSQERHIVAGDSNVRISGASPDMPISLDEIPGWISHLLSRVKELEAQVTCLKQKAECCRSCSHCKSTHPVPQIASSSAVKLYQEQVVADTVFGEVQGKGSQAKNANNQEMSSSVEKCNSSSIAPALDPVSTREVPADEEKTHASKAPQTTEDIHRNATQILSRVADSRTMQDSKKRRLTETYDHLNSQITMNETAIEDALDYIKAIKDVDEATATEQHNQVMELVVSIKQEKEKRTCALADLICYGWKGREGNLLSLIQEEPTEACASGAGHEKLSTISSQMEEKDGVLKNLEAHLKEQLQWVAELPPDLSEADKFLRFKALRKLSKRLAKEQAAKEQLEGEREKVMKSVVQSDAEIRKLVKESLLKGRKTQF